jgi:hypothetical protein
MSIASFFKRIRFSSIRTAFEAGVSTIEIIDRAFCAEPIRRTVSFFVRIVNWIVFTSKFNTTVKAFVKVQNSLKIELLI